MSSAPSFTVLYLFRCWRRIDHVIAIDAGCMQLPVLRVHIVAFWPTDKNHHERDGHAGS